MVNIDPKPVVLKEWSLRTVSASPERLFKMHILRPQPRPNDSETVRLGSNNWCFNKHSNYQINAFNLKLTQCYISIISQLKQKQGLQVILMHTTVWEQLFLFYQ